MTPTESPTRAPTYSNGSPRPYPLPRLRGCAAGAHHARRTDDRDGNLTWVCVRCPAWRDRGDPTWRLP